jgi:hypothetical protein
VDSCEFVLCREETAIPIHDQILIESIIERKTVYHFILLFNNDDCDRLLPMGATTTRPMSSNSKGLQKLTVEC